MSNQFLELELTFLPRSYPAGLESGNGVLVVDHYFPPRPLTRHPRLRLRSSGGKFTLTKKIPVNSGDASKHIETSIELDQAEYEAIANASDRVVRKRRYRALIEGRSAEVDVFEGSLSGLILIDFEFNDERELNSFRVPAVCLADVTQEDFIAGGKLAGRSYRDIEQKLKAFKYEALYTQ